MSQPTSTVSRLQSQVSSLQIKTIHTLLPPHLKDKELKAEFIASFTEDANRSSTRDLTFYEAEELIYFLRTGKNQTFAAFATFDHTNRQHRYILSIAHQLGWVVYHNGLKKMVPDLERLGAWLRKYGYLHQPLKAYTAEQLPKLITQFEKLLKTQTK